MASESNPLSGIFDKAPKEKKEQRLVAPPRRIPTQPASRDVILTGGDYGR